MKSGLRRLLSMFIITVFFIQIAGCAPKEPAEGSKKVTIKVAFWGSPEEIEIITTTVKNW